MFFIIILYIVCTVCSYKYFQAVYSKGGRWEILNPEASDFILILVPIFNIIPAIEYISGSCYKDNKRNMINKILRIKKDK